MRRCTPRIAELERGPDRSFIRKIRQRWVLAQVVYAALCQALQREAKCRESYLQVSLYAASAWVLSLQEFWLVQEIDQHTGGLKAILNRKKDKQFAQKESEAKTTTLTIPVRKDVAYSQACKTLLGLNYVPNQPVGRAYHEPCMAWISASVLHGC